MSWMKSSSISQSMPYQPMRASQPLGIDALGYRPPTPAELADNPAMQAALAAQKSGIGDTTQGELGIFMHPDNRTWSHEVSITERNPAGRGWVNVPLLTSNQDPNALLRILMGQPSLADRQTALARAKQRAETGATMKSYPSAKIADKAAVAREQGFWDAIAAQNKKP